jgi:hypothetical protein
MHDHIVCLGIGAEEQARLVRWGRAEIHHVKLDPTAGQGAFASSAIVDVLASQLAVHVPVADEVAEELIVRRCALGCDGGGYQWESSEESESDAGA